MDKEKQKFINSLYLPLGFIAIIWIVKVVETIAGISFVQFGVYPRNTDALTGIILYPFIHGNWDHLFSNTLPILFLGTGIGYFYPSVSKRLFVLLYLIPGIIIWLIARPSYHIGASGIVYGMVTFLFFSGVIRRDRRAISLALLVTFLYGSLVWGLLPIKSGISWEGHLAGSLVGIAAAIMYRKYDPYDPYGYEEENEIDEIDIN